MAEASTLQGVHGYRGLYIHVPYCQVRCHYCAFYSKTRFDPQEPSLFMKTVIHELAEQGNLHFDTIYIGGGTPTMLGAGLVEMITEVASVVDMSRVREFTIEANPESLTPDLLQSLKHHTPVNRISIGVQSFDDDTLAFLNRPHRSSDAVACIENSLHLGFNTCADIIFDIPTVPDQHTMNDIQTLGNLGVQHISAYSYTPDTNFMKDKIDPDKTIFDQVANAIVGNGYGQYEVSNFAKQGYESKHNTIYWHMGEYIGLGPSAHSMVYNENGERLRYKNASNTKLYCQNYKKYRQHTHLTTQQQLLESFVFPLRTSEGVDVANVLARMPRNGSGSVNADADAGNVNADAGNVNADAGNVNADAGNVNADANADALPILRGLPHELQVRTMELVNRGLLRPTPKGVTTTPKGLLLLDSVMDYLYY